MATFSHPSLPGYLRLKLFSSTLFCTLAFLVPHCSLHVALLQAMDSGSQSFF